MSYLPGSATGVIDAKLTRIGRWIFTNNDIPFAPSQFACADDEINYQLLNPDNIDQDDPDILALPIPEPSTNENNEMLNLIWVNNTFLGQRFSATSQQTNQKVNITSSVGDVGILYSDDTTRNLGVWITTLNQIDRPYVADYYRLSFNNDFDFYTVEFVNPVKSDTVNNNYEPISRTEYIFQAANKDSSGRYTSTRTGSPAIVMNIRLTETPQFFAELAKPENRERILIPNFLTVTQIDASRQALADVQSSTFKLEIKNILS